MSLVITLVLGNDIRKPDEFTFWFPPFFFLDLGGDRIAIGLCGKSEVLFQQYIG